MLHFKRVTLALTVLFIPDEGKRDIKVDVVEKVSSYRDAFALFLLLHEGRYPCNLIIDLFVCSCVIPLSFEVFLSLDDLLVDLLLLILDRDEIDGLDTTF